MLKLSVATRDDQLALIAAQQRFIEQLRAENAELRATIQRLAPRVRELEAKLDKGGPRGFPGLKALVPQSPERRSRKRRAHGYGRARMRPTRPEVHAAAQCTGCGTGLNGGSVKRTRAVIEVRPGAVEVTEHVLAERCCQSCGRRVMPVVNLDGQVVGRQRLGVGLVSLIVRLGEEARLQVAVIRRYLATVDGLNLGGGAIVAASRRVAERGRPGVDRIRARVRASPVVHADESGWRRDGRVGYVWTFSTPAERYFLRPSD